MARYFISSDNTIIRQNSNFEKANDTIVAKCTVFVTVDGALITKEEILNKNELESIKEISLDDVYKIASTINK